jgi:transposase
MSRRWRARAARIDARVLAALVRRDLVPELWIPSLDDRPLRERLRRRTHLVRMRASAMNRICGLQTQWVLRVSLGRLRAPDAMTLLAQQGMPAVWRRSIAEALDVIDLLDGADRRFAVFPGDIEHHEVSGRWVKAEALAASI